MASVPDFGRKLDLVLKAFNLSRSRLAQTVGIDKSVVGRWATGVTVPTDHNLSLLTAAVTRLKSDFGRLDWELDLAAFTARLGVATEARPPPALPDRPSIAVLPFTNMSGKPDEDYFADGIVEDIITALSRFKSLFVIARNSSFSYKGTSPDIRQVGRDLGVRYVLEGSVRKAGDRLRITGQLIDAASGGHLWAERYDGALEDVFDLQDRITASVVGAVAPTVDRAERERARRQPAENLDAYDCYLRGMAQLYDRTPDSCTDAHGLFQRAIALDPGFATPYGMTACCLAMRKSMGWAIEGDGGPLEIRRLAERVSLVGRDDALALSWAGFTLVWMCREYDTGAALADRALAVNPNLGVAWINRGFISIYLGEHAQAIGQLQQADRLSPIDPEFARLATAMSWAHFLQGRNEEGLAWASRAVTHDPEWMPAVWASTLANAFTGNLVAARQGVARLHAMNPGLRVSSFPALIPFRQSRDMARTIDGFRIAGLAE